MRVLSQSLVWWVSGRMTFLDLTEGDKLAVVVVELHVGPSDSVMRSGIKIRYLAHAHISWFWRLTRMSASKKHVYVILENKRRRRNPYYALSLAAFWSVDVMLSCIE